MVRAREYGDTVRVFGVNKECYGLTKVLTLLMWSISGWEASDNLFILEAVMPHRDARTFLISPNTIYFLLIAASPNGAGGEIAFLSFVFWWIYDSVHETLRPHPRQTWFTRLKQESLLAIKSGLGQRCSKWPLSPHHHMGFVHPLSRNKLIMSSASGFEMHDPCHICSIKVHSTQADIPPFPIIMAKGTLIPDALVKQLEPHVIREGVGGGEGGANVPRQPDQTWYTSNKSASCHQASTKSVKWIFLFLVTVGFTWSTFAMLRQWILFFFFFSRELKYFTSMFLRP